MDTDPHEIDDSLSKMLATDAVIDTLLGREKGSFVRQYIKSHAADIKMLLARGLSAPRISKLLSPSLGAQPTTILAALRASGLVQKQQKKSNGLAAEPSAKKQPSRQTNSPQRSANANSKGDSKAGTFEVKPDADEL